MGDPAEGSFPCLATHGVIFSPQDLRAPGNTLGVTRAGFRIRGWSLELKNPGSGAGPTTRGAGPGARGRVGRIGLPSCSREFGFPSARSGKGCGWVGARMLEVHIPSVGPEAEGPRQSPEKGHMVSKWTKSMCGDLPNTLVTSAKGTQNSGLGLGHSSQRFGVTWLCQSLGQWSGLLGRVEQRGGPVSFFFQVCVGFGRGSPER